MRKPFFLAAAVAFFAAASLPVRAAEIVVFENAGFRGQSRRITDEVPNLRDLRFNDRISSFRILSGVWEVCRDADFRGQCETFDRDVPNLDRHGWNDAISSLRPLRRREERPDRWDRDRPVPPPPVPPSYEPPSYAPRIVVFEGRGFNGNRRVFTSDVYNLSDLDFNDRIESVSVEGGVWELCSDSGYRGRCELIDADVWDLEELDFGRTVSSLRPAAPESAGPRRSERGPLTIFADADFRGVARSLWRDVPDLRDIGFQNTISSVRVAGGAWELCEAPGYRGRCIVVRGDERNLRDLGFNDRVSSIRRVRRRD
jgi:hypothetical protein